MKKHLILFLWLTLPLLCMAQNSLAFMYEYDNAGNRVRRKVVTLNPPDELPPAPTPPDSLQVTSYELQEVASPASFVSPELATPNYFVETIAQVEMKIYPNPTTEKITLEISGWKDLKTGIFKLFSLNGQLLQEQPVHSTATVISLTGLSSGAYILKVFINDTTEDWKVIKN